MRGMDAMKHLLAAINLADAAQHQSGTPDATTVAHLSEAVRHLARAVRILADHASIPLDPPPDV